MELKDLLLLDEIDIKTLIKKYYNEDAEYRSNFCFENFLQDITRCINCNDFIKEEEVNFYYEDGPLCEQCLIDGYGK